VNDAPRLRSSNTEARSVLSKYDTTSSKVISRRARREMSAFSKSELAVARTEFVEVAPKTSSSLRNLATIWSTT
jgi:hypothetical protein